MARIVKQNEVVGPGLVKQSMDGVLHRFQRAVDQLVSLVELANGPITSGADNILNEGAISIGSITLGEDDMITIDSFGAKAMTNTLSWAGGLAGFDTAESLIDELRAVKRPAKEQALRRKIDRPKLHVCL